jgi:hypothetical protein
MRIAVTEIRDNILRNQFKIADPAKYPDLWSHAARTPSGISLHS